jgi:hypothetical protein
MDLDRAATFFYLDPSGETHKIFLDHALKILIQLKDNRLRKYKKEILSFKKATSKSNYSERERMNIADKILTIGILLKPKV